MRSYLSTKILQDYFGPLLQGFQKLLDLRIQIRTIYHPKPFFYHPKPFFLSCYRDGGANEIKGQFNLTYGFVDSKLYRLCGLQTIPVRSQKRERNL